MAGRSVDNLKKVPLFTNISIGELELIAEKLEPVSFKLNDIIIKEGDAGNCLYIINRGEVTVSATVPEENEEIILTRLYEGDYFGEMALITGEPRSATVRASTDVNLWKLDKTDFDNLIMHNPEITLSLTHMLSQRLKDSNRKIEQRERFFKSQITPKGQIDEIGVFNLLKYVEENSLTGRLYLMKDDKKALFYYEKGQLSRLDYQGKDEDDALDELLQWETGSFKIEPKIYEIMDQIQSVPAHKKIQPAKLFDKYLTEKFMEFIKIAGARNIQIALNRSSHKFEPYFKVSKGIRIQIAPSLVIKMNLSEEWTDKHTLYIAVLMRDIVRSLERDVVGLDLWSPRSSLPLYDSALKDIQFYDYYEQAVDFIRD
ncbi:MAG: cyclic nucleotide-binding domain-containing protein [Calditrichaceae bacterium]|nr:cyclic nucleotide-binding domain-containing protein [Calditrichaceae bacterium]MBN2708752.1 cyclic nucleotide-binding domain-containing protein [Calditrichaceae bacterium]RQV97119.1 MAG: DUF4388 domain-containing protein [Calditrichota bacterium]